MTFGFKAVSEFSEVTKPLELVAIAPLLALKSFLFPKLTPDQLLVTFHHFKLSLSPLV